jgi:hypothetical protein
MDALKPCIVTGLWDLGRDQLKPPFQRSFGGYLERFRELLTLDVPMHVFIPAELKDEVLRIRGDRPTAITIKEVADFERWFPFCASVDKIRTDPTWLARAGWLPDSPQAALPMYNPILMSKVFMVHDACLMDKLDCTHYYWLDGGINNTVGLDVLEQAIPRLPDYSGDQLALVSYPYESTTEVHGFEAQAFDHWCGEKSTYVCRGGFFGGCKDVLHAFNHDYYHLLQDTLNDELMGADENIITIYSHRHKEKVKRYELKPENHGLLGTFFRHLKDKPPLSVTAAVPHGESLYLLSYNSPEQLKALLQSFELSDPAFLTTPRLYLINNSTYEKTRPEYDELCKQYKIECIHYGSNLGICGARQYAAEHFDASLAAHYLFAEDDMLLAHPDTKPDDFGLPRYVPELYKKSLALYKASGLDFLKLNFSEFFGSNDENWAWTNLPAEIRREWYPDHQEVDPHNIRQTAPRTRFTSVFRTPSVPGLAALLGEVHYCNWMLWIDRIGNKKIFLDTKWAHPREQTQMSFVHQLQRAGKIHAGVLLASPVVHNRFHHYPADERRES